MQIFGGKPSHARSRTRIRTLRSVYRQRIKGRRPMMTTVERKLHLCTIPHASDTSWLIAIFWEEIAHAIKKFLIDSERHLKFIRDWQTTSSLLSPTSFYTHFVGHWGHRSGSYRPISISSGPCLASCLWSMFTDFLTCLTYLQVSVRAGGYKCSERCSILKYLNVKNYFSDKTLHAACGSCSQKNKSEGKLVE